MRFGLVWLALSASVLAVGCNFGASAEHGGDKKIAIAKKYAGEYPIPVVCTTGMVADLAKHVGGERVSVSHLMVGSIDPHRYKASAGDLEKLSSGALIFYSGLHLEGKMSDIFVRLARTKPTFAVTEYIGEQHVLEDEEQAYDPHLWFDVSLWREAVGVVRDVLVEFDPPGAETYQANATAYQAELAALHTWAREQLATIPKEQRVMVTAHDAFRYFGRAYDVEVRAIQGISTEDEAGLKKVNELVDFIAQRKIKAVFVETTVSEQNIRSLIEGCEKRGHQVTIGGELFSDAMGEEGTPEGSYVGMIRHNVNTLVKALK